MLEYSFIKRTNNLAVLNISFYKNNEDFSLNIYLKQHFPPKDNKTYKLVENEKLI